MGVKCILVVIKLIIRYCRWKEIEKVLKFIYGGSLGLFYGVWDYIVVNVLKELVGEFIIGYKRGKYI